MPIETKDLAILTGTPHTQLAHNVAGRLGMQAQEVCRYFPDGETTTELKESVRDKWVFIIQPTGSPRPNDSLMELQQMAWVAKSCSARRVTAIIPYFGYARSDRMNKKRVSVAVNIARNNIFNSGVDDIVTLDIHSEQSMGGDRPRRWDNLYASSVLVPVMLERNMENVRVIAPDTGAVGRATVYNNMINGEDGEDIVIALKKRNPDNRDDVIVRGFSDSVAGVNGWIVDDIVDTYGTLDKVIYRAKMEGINSVRAAITHGVLSGPALERLSKSLIDELLITDTIDQPKRVLQHPKITVVSVSPLLAETIVRKVNHGSSLSELFHMPVIDPQSRSLFSMA